MSVSKRARSRRRKLALAVAAAMTPVAAQAATITVNATADVVLDDNECTLREAVESANNDASPVDECSGGLGADTIVFSLPDDSTITLSAGALQLTEAVTIDGSAVGGTDGLTIDAANSSRIFTIDDGTLGTATNFTLRALTLANGDDMAEFAAGGGAVSSTENLTLDGVTVRDSSSFFDGGGVLVLEEHPLPEPLPDPPPPPTFTALNLTIQDSTVTGNFASCCGGGVKAVYANVLIENSTFDTNFAGAYGGGIALQNPITATLNTVSIGGDPATEFNLATVGGGLYIDSFGPVTITNSTISGNIASGGGGIMVSNYYYDAAPAPLTINTTTLQNNDASYGGGALLFGVEDFLIEDSIIDTNAAFSGGGIVVGAQNGAGVIRDTTISGNTADGGGGGVYFSFYETLGDGTLTLEQVRIRNNTATYGGGIGTAAADFPTEPLMIVESEISGNTASGTTTVDGPVPSYGGGIELYFVHAEIINSTVSGNSAVNGTGGDSHGGGIFVGVDANAVLRVTTVANNSSESAGGNMSVYGGVIDLENSIVADGTAGTDNEIEVASGTVEADYSVIEDPSVTVTGANNITTDPQLGTLQNNGGPTQTQKPAQSSPAVDSGDPLYAGPANDQRLLPRPVNIVDRGAVELQPGVLSIDPSSVNVAENGTSINVTVTRTGGAEGAVSVDIATLLTGSATSGVDYAAASDTLTWPDGDSAPKTLTITINDDLVFEGNETFNVELSNATGGASIGTADGTVTILDNEGPPTISITDVSDAEGTGAGTTTFPFQITLSHPSSQAVSVDVATSGGTATSGADFTPVTTTTVTFDPLQNTPETVNVTIDRDAVDENDETFDVNLSNASGGTIAAGAAGVGTGTIQDDDAPPTLSIGNANVTEGNAGEADLTFDVTLSAASEKIVSVEVSTSPGTATAGTDYDSLVAQVVTFNPGDPLTKQVVVKVNGDTIDENDETLTATLANESNATLLDGTGDGLIEDDDPPPTVSVGPASVTEGDAVDVNLAFTVTLSAPSEKTINVDFDTAGGTATSGADFDPVSTNIQFDPGGALSQQVNVTVNGDLADEPDETLTASLSNPTNATIAGGPAQGTIIDNDAPPTVSVGNASVTEGDAGQVNLNFDVVVTGQTEQDVSVRFATAGGSATSGADFDPVDTVLLFNAGDPQTQQVSVPVNGDLLDEIDETFSVTLSNESNATINDGDGTGTILDDDDPPVVSISDASVTEGDAGTVDLAFQISLDGPSGQTITVDVSTAGSTATSGTDFDALSNVQVQFAPGEVTHELTVTVHGDTVVELNETLTATLSNATGATLGDAIGDGTIVDDDPAVVSIGDASVVEGDAGTADLVFDVTLSEPSGQMVSVEFATAGGTATAGTDFVSSTGTVQFNPGETSKEVRVAVNGDTTVELNETLTVTLSNASNATVGDATGAGTILDDDSPSVSISDAMIVEGNSGATNLQFEVALSAASGRSITVDFATANLSATAPSDYAPANGTLVFNPGDVSETVTVPVNGDLLDEGNEQLQVTLSNASNANIATATAVGTIVDDDGAPVVSVGDASVTEGDGGTVQLLFDVTLSAASGQNVSVQFATSGNTATSGTDFDPVVTTVTFAPGGPLTQQVPVVVNGDVLDEIDETLTATLSNPSNVNIGDGTATGTILDDDAAPTINVGDASSVESGASLVFDVTLSAPSGQVITVDFGTGGGTADGGDDYTVATGTLQFEPGDPLTQQVTVPLIDDPLDEPDETAEVTLSNATNVTIVDGTGVGTILDDDAVPTLSISSVTAPEGDSGGTSFIFDVTLSAPSSQTVTVDFNTAGVEATAGTDFTAASGTLQFDPGVTARQITVTVVGDTLDELDERFNVVLSNPVNAGVGGGGGIGTITDDDGEPSISIADVNEAEGNAGTTSFLFDVTLSAPSAQTITVDFQATGIDATAGADFTAVGGTVQFDPGVTSQQISVPVAGDTLDEVDERFNVTLSNATNAAIADGTGMGTIVDDDGGASISITDVTEAEGDAGATSFLFDVTLSTPSAQTITVDFQATGIDATAGVDFTAVGGTVQFDPGVTSQQISVPVSGDTVDEVDERFDVTLSNATNATIADTVGAGTIADDDAPPAISISDVTELEGNSGTASFTFDVTLSGASSRTITVDFSTAGVTATAGADFASSAGTVQFDPGVTTQQVIVQVNADTVDEPNETFQVLLANASNATIADATGTGSITDDDGSPALSVSDASEVEGDAGTTSFVFTVTLAPASGQAVTVDFATADGTAAAGTDYQATSGQLTFAAGQMSQDIVVLVNGDTLPEPSESFEVVLSAPVNASLADDRGTGTIANDDAAAATADLSLTKSIVTAGPYLVGETVTFEISVSNDGPDGATSVTITDEIPAGLTLLSATPSTGTCSGTATVTCNVGTVGAEDSASVTLVVRIDLPGSYTNVASADAEELDPTPASASAAFTAVAAAAGEAIPTASEWMLLVLASALAAAAALKMRQ